MRREEVSPNRGESSGTEWKLKLHNTHIERDQSNRRFGYLTRSGNKGYLSFCGTAWFAATSFREITWYGSGFGYRLKLIASARASLPTKVDGDDLVKYLFFGN